MTGATLAPVWQIGPRVSAQVLGLPFNVFRPSGAGNPLTTPLTTTPAWITADRNLKAAAPWQYGKPIGFAAVDPAIVRVGDYLVGSLVLGQPAETFFVASMDLPAPIMVVRCNRVLTVSRPVSNVAGGYGGDTTSALDVLLTSWPAAVTQGTKGERGESVTPGDLRNPWVVVLLPPSVPVQLRNADVADDDEPQPDRYTISNAESTPLGWRLTAGLATS